MKKKTLVFGASTNSQRYSYFAIERLKHFVATQIPGMANMTAGLAAGQQPQMPPGMQPVSPVAGSVPPGNQPLPGGNGSGQQYTQGVPT